MPYYEKLVVYLHQEKNDNANGLRWVVHFFTMRNFVNEYRTLITNVINEVISLLDNANLSELTLFEGHPWDKVNESRKMAIYRTYHIYDDQFAEYIQKLVKCNGIWGYILVSDEICNDKPQFPKELCARDIDFECANDLYEIVYRMLHSKKTKGKSNLTEIAGVVEVANH